MQRSQFARPTRDYIRYEAGEIDDPAVLADQLQRDQRHREKQKADFKRKRQQRALRKQLLAVNPFCCRCGVCLQGVDPAAECYAHVCCGKLCCHGCVSAVHAAAAVETEVVPC